MSKENKKDLTQLEVGDRITNEHDIEREILAVLERRGCKTVYVATNTILAPLVITVVELKDTGYQFVQPEEQEKCIEGCTEGCFDEVEAESRVETKELCDDCPCCCKRSDCPGKDKAV